MKLKITCAVRSEVILQRRLEFEADGKKFAFEVDGKGVWTAITITADIKDPSKVRWGTEPVEGSLAPQQAPYRVVGEFEPGLFEGVVADVQCLESALSLYMPVRQIDWRYPEMEVLFEDGEARMLGHLGAARFSRGRIPPQKIPEQTFVAVVGIGLRAHDITVVTSFWREGEDDWVAGEFINAFFNYYFVLEGLYGNKKTQNRHIEAEMLKSPGLLTQIDKFTHADHPVQHLKQLARMLRVTKAPTASDLIRLLVSTRGKLHHFQNNSNREQGSPLAHDNYEGIGYLARQLAHGSLLELTGTIIPVAFGSAVI